MRITCLHTAESNAAIFEAARQDLGDGDLMLSHEIRADLLAAAECAGGLTPKIARQTGQALLALCEDADAVVLTCSTLGPAVAEVEETAPVPILRVDGALAREAVQGGGKVAVLCSVETTVAPTRALFEESARATGAEVEVRLVDGAWAAYKAGDQHRYLSMIAQATDNATREGASCVALAQASMAGAAKLSKTSSAVLSSPVVGLAAAIAAFRAAAAKRLSQE